MMASPSLLLLAAGAAAGAGPRSATAEDRALGFLAREVPRWARENSCHSCHNNGDAARALYAAVRAGRKVPPAALADTTRWLQRPEGWDRNGGEGPSGDRKLARLQFAAALAAAVDAGLAKDRKALRRAAELVAGHQEKDGSWKVVAAGTLGSPATHGDALATYLARRTLGRADPRRHRAAIARADGWLRKVAVKAVPDAAAVLLALGDAKDRATRAQRERCLEAVRKGESRRGGWGPYAGSAPEVFDTALVLLALARQAPGAEVKRWRARGRAFLLATQEDDGGWPETTRPPGAQSYAQRLSTTGWATLALLRTK
jgi:hypothetical protein